MMRVPRPIDQADARLLLGLLALSVGVLWAAFLVGAAIFIVRTIGGL